MKLKISLFKCIFKTNDLKSIIVIYGKPKQRVSTSVSACVRRHISAGFHHKCCPYIWALGVVCSIRWRVTLGESKTAIENEWNSPLKTFTYYQNLSIDCVVSFKYSCKMLNVHTSI